MNFLNVFKGGMKGGQPVRSEPVFTQAVEEKHSAAGPIFSRHIVGRPVWTERNYEQLAREAYFINAISFRCVKMIATCAANIPLVLQMRGKKVGEHPILELLARPSPTQGGQAFLERFFSFLLLSGNGYMESVGPRSGPPRELWVPRSDRMKVIAGATGLPSAFQYEHAGAKKRWQVNQLNGNSEMLHVKEFNPLSDWYGMSRIEAAAYGIDRHNAASRHNKALLDNGARPSGILAFKPIAGTGLGAPINAPMDVIKKAEDELNKRHGGPENSGKPMVVGGAVEWLEMGITPKDMDFGEGKDDAARDICIAWGVPHVLIVKGASTFNNVSEAKLELYEDNVIPFLNTVLDELNNWLTPRFNDGLTLLADLDAVPALEERRVARRKSVTDLLDKRVIDDTEAREMLGYGPRPEGAVEKVDAQVLTALMEVASIFGIHPLARYMRSVGLVLDGMTDEQMLGAALDFVDGSDNGDETDEETSNVEEQ